MAATRAGSKYLIREINESLVLDVLRVQGPASRSTIAKRTGLSPATVTGITARLLDAGLIVEVSQGPSTGGRPPRLLGLGPGGGCVVGARLTEDHVTVATVNLVGEVTDYTTVPWQAGPPEAAVDMLADVVTAQASRGRSDRVLGFGLALSGAVDHDAGVVRHSGSLGWQDVPLRDALADRLGIPVAIDKYVNAMATALVLYGAGVGVGDLLVVNVGRSVGLALIIGGQLHRGAHGAAGAFGHTAISLAAGSDGGRCHCGATGCLETVSSEWGMIRRLQETAGEPLGIDDAASRAATDDSIRAVFETGGETLGRAVADVAKVFDPHGVVLSGEGTRLGELFFDPFERAFHEACSNDAGRDFEVQTTTYDETTWAHGAACQVLSSLFHVSSSVENTDVRSGNESRLPHARVST